MNRRVKLTKKERDQFDKDFKRIHPFPARMPPSLVLEELLNAMYALKPRRRRKKKAQRRRRFLR